MADAKISALTANTAPASADAFPHVDVSDTSEAATGTDKKITWGDITANVVLSGTAAARPAASAVPAGTLYYATDTFILSRTDGSAAWTQIGLSPNIFTGKGNILGASGNDTAVVTTAGTDGQILYVDSSTTSGLDWKGAGAAPIFLSGLGIPVSTATGAINTWYAVRFVLPTFMTITGIRVVTGATANGNVRGALFASDTTTKLADKTTDATQAASGVITTLAFASAYDAYPGTYYALVWYSSATATFPGMKWPTLQSTGTNATTTPANIGTPAFSNSAVVPQMALYT